MKYLSTRNLRYVAILAAATMIACASNPKEDIALNNLASELNSLRADQELASLAPLALTQAEHAVRAARESGLKPDEQAHRILIAEKRIEIARSEAMHARTQAELDTLQTRRNALLLRASRLEVAQARREAEQAQLFSAATMEEIERARRDASSARESEAQASDRAARAREEAAQARRLAEAQATEIELARREAELASQTAESLRRRLEYMDLRETDRGVIVTLSDVLFEVGKSELQATADSDLNEVVELLDSEPGNDIRIEGHTDNSGSADLNLRLSQQRANAVRDALVDAGVAGDRITTVGMGEDFPIAGNETDEGRASNRRVDIILLNQQD